MEQARQLGTDFGGPSGRIDFVVLQKCARFGKRPLQLHCMVYWGRLRLGSAAADGAACFTSGDSPNHSARWSSIGTLPLRQTKSLKARMSNFSPARRRASARNLVIWTLPVR